MDRDGGQKPHVGWMASIPFLKLSGEGGGVGLAGDLLPDPGRADCHRRVLMTVIEVTVFLQGWLEKLKLRFC